MPHTHLDVMLQGRLERWGKDLEYDENVAVMVEPNGVMTVVVGELLIGLRCYFNKADLRTSLFQEREYDAVIETRLGG